MRNRIGLALMLTVGLAASLAFAQGSADPSISPSASQGAQIDLRGPFHARSPWRFVVSEGPPTKDYADGDAPGALTLCLHKGPAGPCLADPVNLPVSPSEPDNAVDWGPHYLLSARLVYPRGPKAAPLLLIVTGSLHAGDGDQIVTTQLVAYDADRDAFRRVFGGRTGINNNQEIRFVSDGPLRGSVISAEPQERLPYGYWIVVNSLTPAGVYRQVLRYQSATRYNDGNPLAVIDSEMPSIERRLGLWKPGQPIPVPKLDGASKPCLKPSLRHAELWCN
jgi:hypothetical protein